MERPPSQLKPFYPGYGFVHKKLLQTAMEEPGDRRSKSFGRKCPFGI